MRRRHWRRWLALPTESQTAPAEAVASHSLRTRGHSNCAGAGAGAGVDVGVGAAAVQWAGTVMAVESRRPLLQVACLFVERASSRRVEAKNALARKMLLGVA